MPVAVPVLSAPIRMDKREAAGCIAECAGHGVYSFAKKNERIVIAAGAAR
jgi:hypothetical protein